MSIDTGEIVRWFEVSPPQARLHVRGRRRLFPFESLIAYLPQEGSFVDIGCGYGIWPFLMASHRPQARVLGFDPDRSKTEIAGKIAVSRGFTNVELMTGAVGDFAIPESDLVSAIDVLYLVDYGSQNILIAEIFERLHGGGVFLLKTMSHRPAWKYLFNLTEETLAVRLFRITKGRRFYFRTEDKWTALLDSVGFRTEIRRLDRGYLHPQLLLIARKG
jgi:2-polyprenyl-3-methyl-5-hydroxy-6-metoxy-1,4-benzoquinol methylase